MNYMRRPYTPDASLSSILAGSRPFRAPQRRLITFNFTHIRAHTCNRSPTRTRERMRRAIFRYSRREQSSVPAVTADMEPRVAIGDKYTSRYIVLCGAVSSTSLSHDCLREFVSLRARPVEVSSVTRRVMRYEVGPREQTFECIQSLKNT